MSRFKRCDCLSAPHRGEVIQAVPSLQVIDQVAQRDTRAYEDGYPAEDLWVAMHNQILVIDGMFHLYRILV
jgi:hypothetical protein